MGLFQSVVGQVVLVRCLKDLVKRLLSQQRKCLASLHIRRSHVFSTPENARRLILPHMARLQAYLDSFLRTISHFPAIGTS